MLVFNMLIWILSFNKIKKDLFNFNKVFIRIASK